MKRLQAAAGVCFAVLMLVAGMLPAGASGSKRTKAGRNNERKIITMAEAAGMYKTQGRTGIVGQGLSIDWSGAGIEFNADCEGDVVLHLKIESVLPDTFFTAFVDGERMDRLEADTSPNDEEEAELTIASGLPRGEHNFRFYNQTECAVATVSIESIALTGQLTDPPEENGRMIEYVGDSYLTGYGCLVKGGDDGDGWDKANISDGSQSLGVMTSEDLKADYSILAVSGYGLVCGIGGRDANMPKYYDYISWERSHTDADAWDFSRQADVVVVELGDNDRYFVSSLGISNDEIQAAAKDFAAHIRSKNPHAKIVWIMYGFEKQIVGALDELGGSDAGFYATTLAMGDSGALGHPTVDELHVSADNLAEYLKDNVLSAPTDVPPETDAESSAESSSGLSEDSASDGETAPDSSGTAKDSSTEAPAPVPDTGDEARGVIPWLIGFDIVAIIVAVVLYKSKKMTG